MANAGLCEVGCFIDYALRCGCRVNIIRCLTHGS